MKRFLECAGVICILPFAMLLLPLALYLAYENDEREREEEMDRLITEGVFRPKGNHGTD